MKRPPIPFASWLHSLAFLLFLMGSSLAHLENGSELSLWLMTFGFIITAATTLFPLFGISWLKALNFSVPWKRNIVYLLQIISWLSFCYAMFLRFRRDMPSFHTCLIATTLLWATWILFYFYSASHDAKPAKCN